MKDEIDAEVKRQVQERIDAEVNKKVQEKIDAEVDAQVKEKNQCRGRISRRNYKKKKAPKQQKNASTL